MSYATEGLTLPGFIAGTGGLATSQFLAVKIASTAGEVVLNATDAFAENIVGILQNAPGYGEAALIQVSGVTKMIVDSTATLAPGDAVGLNTTGNAADNGTTDNGAIIGRCLTAGAVSGDIISVLLIPGGIRY